MKYFFKKIIESGSPLLFLLPGILLCPLILLGQSDNYGAEQANKRFLPSSLGGSSDFQYLNLENHPGNSGVPLGGIGVGNVEFAPDGRFVRIGLNNIHIPIPRSTGSFFSFWFKSGNVSKSQRLVRDDKTQMGMEGVKTTYYKGLFPRAELSFGKEFQSIIPRIKSFSGLVPHDIKNSSLPVVFFEVELEARESGEAAIAFSWEDFIGRGLKEPKSIEGMDGQIFNKMGREKLVNGENWPWRPAIPTFAANYQYGQFRGVRQFSKAPIIPIKATFQNYVDEVAVLAEEQEGLAISTMPSYDPNGEDNKWASFREKGEFLNDVKRTNELSLPGKKAASAICVKTSLKKGEKKVIRFMLVWYYPELKIRKDAAPGSYWPGGSDYGRYFHNYFDRIEQLIQYSSSQRENIFKRTCEWQEPILSGSLPDWYKFKLINSAYVIYTNMVLNKKGDVMINEGGMGGLAGTMDQRISSHPFYQKFFTGLDRSEMGIFADAQAGDGSISHFIGHYYVGMGTVGGRIPTENNWMLDNTEGWIIQVAKDYEQTGDTAYLKKYIGRIKEGMNFLKSKMPKGVAIPVGPTTYDDYDHPPIYSYGAGMYLATLKAAESIARVISDTAWVNECRQLFKRSQKDMIRLLWNGRFFSYGSEIDGSGRLDSILFTGQLAGEFVSRYCGWGDILPFDMIQSSLIAQFKTSISHTPDYYANKVWNIHAGKGIDHPGSQCWPFYLESYTAYPAIQAGYIEDGLDIMRHIQLVHLRKGYTWCQNLWNPAELNYMTAPVTWFSTDLMAGAGLNLPRKELRLAPIILKDQKTTLPLFYPQFWAVLDIDPKSHKIFLKITKTFTVQNHSIRTIIAEAFGRPSIQQKEIQINEFYIKEGNRLDLSRWWNELTDTKFSQAVLPRADNVPFMQVDKAPIAMDSLQPVSTIQDPGHPNYNIFCFYYNWYGNPEHDGKYIHWAHPVLNKTASEKHIILPGGDNIASDFYPALSCYSSRDTNIIRRHLEMIRKANIGVIVLTWWGRNDYTDQSVKLILTEATRFNVKVAFHIEPFAGRSPYLVRQAVEYLVDSYGDYPSFYRDENGDKPMFFIYDSYLIKPDDWATLLKEKGSISIRKTKYDALFIGLWVKEGDGQNLTASGFDGYYTYFASSGFTYGSTPANWKHLQNWATLHNLIFIPCVGPGYIDTRIRPWNGLNSKKRNSGKYYGAMFSKAIESGAPFIGITSFNEWHEGTQIEPAVPFKTSFFKYLDYRPRNPEFYLEETNKWISVFNRKNVNDLKN